MLHDLLASTGDLAALAASIALIALYQAYLRWRSHAASLLTMQGLNAAARRAWVDSVMADKRDVLAVQTLRNSTMAATFLASTAMLLAMGVANLMDRPSAASGWLATGTPGLWHLKLLLLEIDLVFAFFSFALSIRLFNHVGFMINVPEARRPPELQPASVAHHLNRAGHYFGLGMRAYFVLVPLIFWLFGAWLLLAAALGVVVALYRYDRAPQSEGSAFD